MRKTLTLIFLVVLTLPAFPQLNEIDSPIENFEKLWQTFNERYANFALKKVNWDSIYVKYRPMVNSETVNQELFEICCSMLQELNDGHVSIDPDFMEEALECGPPYEFKYAKEFKNKESFRAFEGVIKEELKKNGFSELNYPKVTDATNFQYSTTASFGYLRLDEMTEENTFGRFNRALDAAINAFQNKQGLILDLRFNGGGWDDTAYKIVSRLITEDMEVGHYERARIKGTSQYSKMKYQSFKPKGKLQFTKPIVILTSDYTASAAEVFLLLMKDLPHVTLIGDDSEGIFSDVHEFKLPNDWEIGLSNEQYFSIDSINYEGVGIQPDIHVLNTSKDIETKIDPVLVAALRQLEK